MRLAAIAVTLYLLTSCGARGVKLSGGGGEDSLALSVAVTPTMDCLPVYYAQRMGLFDSLGIEVRLRSYMSQMDIDTALAAGSVDLAHTSLTRLEVMRRKRRVSCDVVAGIAERLYLISARGKRVKSLRQLKGRMVAIDRFSNSDYWSDRITEKGDMELTDIYRPQFNDVRLRYSMLAAQLIDAALLPEPYASEARARGHRQLFATPDSARGFNCFAAPGGKDRGTLRQWQEEAFLRAYARAAEELNSGPNADTLRAILREQYGVEEDVIDSVRLARIKPLAAPSDSLTRSAVAWVDERMSIR